MNEIKEAKGIIKNKIISVEEHFATAKYLDSLMSIIEKTYPDPAVVENERYIANDAPFLTLIRIPETEGMIRRLLDTGKGRIEIMDENGIYMQVLSFVSPGVQVFEPDTAIKMSKEINDRLSRIVREHPTRFSGLAALPLQDPHAAADELERSVKDLGLRGGCIFSHTRGQYPDDKKYWVVFERASKLDVPIYLHPRAPSSNMIEAFSGYPTLEGAMWGFALDTGTSAVRLICSGIFDEYPNLKIVLGHLGEAIPFWLWRIDNLWKKAKFASDRLKLPSQYFKDNFMVTTSGMSHAEALSFTVSVIGANNIMFSLDYPMESPEEAMKFIEKSSMKHGDWEKICHLNAERVFSL